MSIEAEDIPEDACACGSGEPRDSKLDGNGIHLFFHCSKCYNEKIAGVNPTVLRPYTSQDLDAGEAIEPEDY